MIVKTQSIFISSLKYGDHSLVIKCYTLSSGIKSFMAKQVYSKRNKTNPMFSPLNLLEIVFDDKGKTSLLQLRDCRQLIHYTSITTHQQKASISIFLSEILNSVLREEDSNPDLFDFIGSSLQLFDQKQTAFSDFHLWFLIHLSRYLGFYPHFESACTFFDLTNGTSTNQLPLGVYLEGEKLQLFEKLFELDFFEQSNNQFNQNQRRVLLDLILRYYELHLTDFRWPKSLEVLNLIFD